MCWRNLSSHMVFDMYEVVALYESFLMETQSSNII